MRCLQISALLFLTALVAAANTADHWRHDDRGVLIVIAQAPIKMRAWKSPYAAQPEAILAGLL